MSASQPTSFGYRIYATDAGWVWMTFDPAGQVQAEGVAHDKAIAAACVIRALARTACEDASVARRAA